MAALLTGMEYENVQTIAIYSVFAFGCFYVGREALKLVKMLVQPLLSPARILQCPKSRSFIFGHLKEMFATENSELIDEWVKEFGKTFRFKAFVGVSVLYIYSPLIEIV